MKRRSIVLREKIDKCYNNVLELQAAFWVLKSEMVNMPQATHSACRKAMKDLEMKLSVARGIVTIYEKGHGAGDASEVSSDIESGSSGSSSVHCDKNNEAQEPLLP